MYQKFKLVSDQLKESYTYGMKIIGDCGGSTELEDELNSHFWKQVYKHFQEKI